MTHELGGLLSTVELNILAKRKCQRITANPEGPMCEELISKRINSFKITYREEYKKRTKHRTAWKGTPRIWTKARVDLRNSSFSIHFSIGELHIYKKQNTDIQSDVNSHIKF